MVQEGRGLDFTHTIPNTDWILDRKRASLVPELKGVCVTAVGGDVSTPLGVRIREFWTAYFEATGAAFVPDRYRRNFTEFHNLLCAQ